MIACFDVWAKVRGARCGDCCWTSRRTGWSHSHGGCGCSAQVVPFDSDRLTAPVPFFLVGIAGGIEPDRSAAARIGIGSASLYRALQREAAAVSSAMPARENNSIAMRPAANRDHGHNSRVVRAASPAWPGREGRRWYSVSSQPSF